MRMGAVPVRKMVIFFVPGQMLQKQRRPSASLPVAWRLPTKLAEQIGENLQDELGFPDKADQRAEPAVVGRLQS